MLTREDFQNVPEAQYEALLAVNATLITELDALEQRLLEAAHAAGLREDHIVDFVTGWLPVMRDEAGRVRYFITELQKETAHTACTQKMAAQAKPDIQLRDLADVFYCPEDHHVTVNRLDRRSRRSKTSYTDRTYCVTPASEQRILRLMNEHTWPMRTTLFTGWQVANNR